MKQNTRVTSHCLDGLHQFQDQMILHKSSWLLQILTSVFCITNDSQSFNVDIKFSKDEYIKITLLCWNWYTSENTTSKCKWRLIDEWANNLCWSTKQILYYNPYLLKKLSSQSIYCYNSLVYCRAQPWLWRWTSPKLLVPVKYDQPVMQRLNEISFVERCDHLQLTRQLHV